MIVSHEKLSVVRAGSLYTRGAAMKVVGINEVHADSRDVLMGILANGFDRKVKKAILKTDSAKEMGIKRVTIEKVEVFGTQYTMDNDPVGHFMVTVRRPRQKGDIWNLAVYKVCIIGGKRLACDTAYFEKDDYVGRDCPIDGGK